MSENHPDFPEGQRPRPEFVHKKTELGQGNGNSLGAQLLLGAGTSFLFLVGVVCLIGAIYSGKIGFILGAFLLFAVSVLLLVVQVKSGKGFWIGFVIPLLLFAGLIALIIGACSSRF
jgi:hypothetical protein